MFTQVTVRVDSFLFFKFREIRNCTKEFPVPLRLDRFAKLKKYENTKKCFELFRETEKNVSFRSFAYFHLNFVPSLRMSNLLFEFRTFNSSFVHLFKFRTY